MYARFFIKALADMGLLDVQEPFQRALHAGDDHPRRGEDVQVEGQRDQPGGLRRALRRRHRALLHPVHRPARPGRRLDATRASRACTASSAGCGGWAPRWPSGGAPAAARAGRRRRRATTSSCCARRTGRSTRSPNDMAGRFAFNTAISAVMELVNECYAPARARCATATLHFADGDGRVADLPVRAALRRRRLRAADRRRACGRSRGRRPTRRCSSATRSSSSCRSTASCATASRRRRRRRASELEALARERPNVQAHLDGKEVVKVVVVPGKLVNFVVR